MKSFKVTLIFEGQRDFENDPAHTVEVTVPDESFALKTASDKIINEHPDINMAKIWCWHIEKIMK